MAEPGAAAPPTTARDHSFHPLRLAQVIAETADASSFVFEVPDELAAAFAYQPGQFCTFKATVDGEELLRCYSMSSAPTLDEPLQVTVKRVPGGRVSNWMIDTLAAGDTVEVTVPAGRFLMDAGEGDIVAFAAGSGITPIYAILKTALAETDRRVRLLYANRDRDSIIFDEALVGLADRYGDRLSVVHHLDAEQGFVDASTVAALCEGADDPEAFICGPGPFMDIVEDALVGRGVPTERIHIERFIPAENPAFDQSVDAAVACEVTIELKGKKGTTTHRPGTTVLQVARELGMSPPFSCESGSCATCMARLVEGEVVMATNDALTPDEVDEGWILTCQSMPTSATLHVVYE